MSNSREKRIFVRSFISLSKVFLRLVGVDGSISGLPVYGANFISVFIGKLKSVDKSDGFINTSSNRWIILGDLSQDSLLVDDEETSQRVSGVQ